MISKREMKTDCETFEIEEDSSETSKVMNGKMTEGILILRFAGLVVSEMQ